MNVAIIHDSIPEFGGAERVLQVLLSMFPLAHVYTAFADTKIKNSFFTKLPASRLHVLLDRQSIIARHGALFQLFSPYLWRSVNLEGYDLVLSMTSYLGANMVRPSDSSVHVQYIHSVPKNIIGLEPPFHLQRFIPYAYFLKKAYQSSLKSTPYIIANSNHIRRTIKRYFGVASTTLYPPVTIPPRLPIRKPAAYYLCISRLDSAKGLELAITACTTRRFPLKIVGSAFDTRYGEFLRSLAGPTVEFLGFRTDEEIAKLYERAIALIFTPKNEDFGITPVEAMAHGVPVIAYWGGGAKETVLNKRTGIFFYRHTADSLSRALSRFHPAMFSPLILYQHAQTFAEAVFRQRMNKYIKHALPV